VSLLVLSVLIGVPEKEDKLICRAMATCLAMNPRDINIMLIGYEGGVVAWDFRQNQVVKTFEMLLPPGAPGGGTYQNTDVRPFFSSSCRADK
jgi:hypothetical protein